MSKMQREKGKRFERQIADILRQRWPSSVVRRASQAERADNPDLFVEGVPVLERLWLELQDAREPTPEAKLVQAEHDSHIWLVQRGRTTQRLPVAIWHNLGERTIWATTRLWVLDALRNQPGKYTPIEYQSLAGPARRVATPRGPRKEASGGGSSAYFPSPCHWPRLSRGGGD